MCSLWSQLTKYRHHCKCRIYEISTENTRRYRITPLDKRLVLAFLLVVILQQRLHLRCTCTMKSPLQWDQPKKSKFTSSERVSNEPTIIRLNFIQETYSNERRTPIALVRTSGSRQYPNTLAVRRKLTPVRDIKFNMKCNDIVPSKMKPYTYPKWLFPL